MGHIQTCLPLLKLRHDPKPGSAVGVLTVSGGVLLIARHHSENETRTCRKGGRHMVWWGEHA